MRRPIIAGNWKMCKSIAQTRSFFDEFKPLVAGSAHCEIVICPTYLSLQAASEVAYNSRIEIGGQNVFWEKEGAYTGEVSAEMLTSAGCKWVLIAHSERRQYFGETDESAFKKVRASLQGGLTPIVCIGEVLNERESGQTHAVLKAQFYGAMGGLTPEEFARVVIAYEPVWAIGTGKTATPEIAADAHRVIRHEVGQNFGDAAGEACRILYGGSVKPGNVKGLMAQPDIDGALVGGASLVPADFASIVNYP